MIHYFGWNEFWLPLPSFSFSLRSVCPPTQQMAKVKHISVFWCTSLCAPCKWQRCQSPTLFHPVSQTSMILWRHLRDLHLQFITSRKEILEILGRFILPSTLHFTLCATGSVCVYPAHAELKISRFHSGRWPREGRAEENKNIFEIGTPFHTHKERFCLKLFMRVTARKDDTHHRVSGPV